MKKTWLVGVFLLVISILSVAADINQVMLLKDSIIYEMPSSDSEYLMVPSEGCFDRDGNLWVLDVGAKAVFSWDQKGAFLGTVGRGGEGPGEFTLESLSTIGHDGEHIIVYDAGLRKMEFFKDGQYKRTVTLPLHITRLADFKPLSNGRLAIVTEEFGQNPTTKVIVTDWEFTEQKVLKEIPSQSFRKNELGGYDFYPYAKKLIIYADYFYDRILVGDKVTPTIWSYDLNGNLIEEIPVTLTPQLVTEKDKRNLRMRIDWLQGGPDRPVFSEYKTLFQVLIPVSQNQILVTRNDPAEGFYSGIVYDQSKTGVARFHQIFGELGGIVFSNNRLIAFYNDENGEYAIKTVKPVFANSH